MQAIRFLSVADVLELHRETIDVEGGSHGVRDLGLLESAIAMPQQTFGGAFLHEDLVAMAAAYLYHISSNHPFIDGNKRAAVLAALIFLEENGVSVAIPPDQLEGTVLHSGSRPDGQRRADSMAQKAPGRLRRSVTSLP